MRFLFHDGRVVAAHAEIWLPVNPKDIKRRLLVSEAWSAGDLVGAGCALWVSSKRINEIARASALRCGLKESALAFAQKPKKSLINKDAQ